VHAAVAATALGLVTVPLSIAAHSAPASPGDGGPPLVLEALPGIVPVAAGHPLEPAVPHLAWPLSGEITQAFGPTSYWFEPRVVVGRVAYPHFHTGIDIAAPFGTAVAAAAPGQVEFAGWEGGYGETVVVLHPGGLRTLYAHLNSVRVARGRTVEVGTVLGLEGATGNATGPHLHFEVRTAPQVVVNPMGYLAPDGLSGQNDAVAINWGLPATR